MDACLPGGARTREADLDWAHELATLTSAAEQGGDVAQRRSFGTDKAWHALAYLLDRAGFPVAIVQGEEWFVDDLDDPEADWGYGAPCYLTPEQVRQASSALWELSADDLVRGVDRAELARAEIYPAIWDRPGDLSWVTHDLPFIRTYFAAAADAGDAVICWIG